MSIKGFSKGFVIGIPHPFEPYDPVSQGPKLWPGCC